jgi:hypothetical protein
MVRRSKKIRLTINFAMGYPAFLIFESEPERLQPEPVGAIRKEEISCWIHE